MLEAGLRGTSIDWELDERAFDLTKSAGFASLCFAILVFVKCISEKTKTTHMESWNPKMILHTVYSGA